MKADAPVVFVASGTRGDVQPYLALARALQRSGVPVRIASHTQFQTWVEAQDLPYAALSDNPSEWLARTPTLFTAPPSTRVLRNSLVYLSTARDMTARLLTSAARACAGASAIVAGLSSLWVGSIAEAANVPVVWAFLQPLTPTRAFASSVWPLRHSSAVASRASYTVVDAASWWPWRSVVNRWRRAHTLPALGARGMLHRLHERGDTILNGFSRHLVAAPADWPAGCAPAGFWFAETAPMLNAATERFLEAADDVVYFGAGAGSAMDPRALLALAHDALLRLNARAVVNLHGAEHVPDAFKARMHAAQDLPHAALFPRLRAVVHHGGAGTTAEVARAGVPAVVLPVFADQFFWAERAHAAGVAPAPIPQRRLSRSGLAAALQAALGHEPMRSSARALAERIRGEDGIAAAVATISSVVARAARERRDWRR